MGSVMIVRKGNNHGLDGKIGWIVFYESGMIGEYNEKLVALIGNFDKINLSGRS